MVEFSKQLHKVNVLCFFFLSCIRPRQNEDNIVSYDVARPWQNAATLLRAARTQEMFLKIFRNIFCVQDTKFVSVTNVACVAKRVNIWET